MSSIGQRVYDYRQRHEMSQQRFAEFCKLDRSYITQIENGKKEPGRRARINIEFVLNNE